MARDPAGIARRSRAAVSGLALREGISFCLVGEQVIFLDVLADRYFCLSAAVERSFLLLVNGQSVTAAENRHIAGLITRGLLVSSSSKQPPHACSAPPFPKESIFDYDLPRASFLQVGSALCSLGLAAIRLKTLGLAGSLKRIAAGKAGLSSNLTSDVQCLERAAASFQSVGQLVSLIDNCLVHSLAVAMHMVAQGFRPELVLGVRLGPFSAHCWIQHNGMLFNDRLDIVRTYTPILAI